MRRTQVTAAMALIATQRLLDNSTGPGIEIMGKTERRAISHMNGRTKAKSETLTRLLRKAKR